MGKASLRRDMRAKRSALTPEAVAEKSAAICAKVLPMLSEFSCVGAYLPIHNEVDTRPLIQALQTSGKRVALPYIDDSNTMGFRLFRAGDALAPDTKGIASCEGEICTPEALIVPLLAYDDAGFRLGYGGGFYDRAIAQLKAANPKLSTLGLAYSLQRVPHLSVEPHDARLDAIFTETDIA